VDWSVSNDAVGLLLLGLTLASLLGGGILSFRGLGRVDDAAKKAAEAAEKAEQVASQMAARAEAGGGTPPTEVADVSAAAGSVQAGIGGVNEALAELKGDLAPARAFLALALLFFLASLVAFDVIAIDLTADTGAGTTTTTETTP
jgi:hypothetical protein